MSKTFAQILEEAREHPMYESLKHQAYIEYTTRVHASKELDWHRSKNRFWFYRPQMHWHGWSTLLPITTGHDDYARNTIMIGWTITGRIIIALGDCGERQCLLDVHERFDREHEEWIASL